MGKKAVLLIIIALLTLKSLAPFHGIPTLKARISAETGCQYVTIGKVTLQGRHFIASDVDLSQPHTPEVTWYKGYIDWLGAIYIIDYQVYKVTL